MTTLFEVTVKEIESVSEFSMAKEQLKIAAKIFHWLISHFIVFNTLCVFMLEEENSWNFYIFSLGWGWVWPVESDNRKRRNVAKFTQKRKARVFLRKIVRLWKNHELENDRRSIFTIQCHRKGKMTNEIIDYFILH